MSAQEARNGFGFSAALARCNLMFRGAACSRPEHCGCQRLLSAMASRHQINPRTQSPLRHVLRESGWLMLWLISLTTIVRCRLRGISQAHYLIDSAPEYDKRSISWLAILPPDKTINFLHVSSVWHSLRTFWRKSNPFYFEAFLNRASWTLLDVLAIAQGSAHPDETELLEANLRQHKKLTERRVRRLKSLMLFTRIKDFLLLDDGRHTNELILAAGELGIRTSFYMHNRFNEFHTGVFAFPPARYFVWSPYFSGLFAQFAPEAERTECLVTGYPGLDEELWRSQPAPSTDTILLLGETNIQPEWLIPFLNALPAETRVIFRPKSSLAATAPVCDRNLFIDRESSLPASIRQHRPAAIVGTHSTALLEGWLYRVPALTLETDYDYGQHIWRDGFSVHCRQPADMAACLQIARSYSSQERDRIREALWGQDPRFKRPTNLFRRTADGPAR